MAREEADDAYGSVPCREEGHVYLPDLLDPSG